MTASAHEAVVDPFTRGAPGREALEQRRGARLWAIRAALLLTVTVAALALGEIAARALGRGPWIVEDIGATVDPGGRFFQTHPTLGYRHLSGRFTVTLKTGYSFTATHGTDTLRITHPADSGPAAGARQIWIFGCSITYGWSVNDWETYPWLLQDSLPNHEVVNFGVNGYGTLHSLIQLREALERGARPALVVIAYAQIHDERNTFTRTRRKTIAPWNRLGPLLQPYGRLDANGDLQTAMAEVQYAEFPFMKYSALSHWTEELYDRFERRMLRSRDVTLAIIAAIEQVARSRGVPLLIAGIRAPRLPEVFAWARARGIPVADISVDDRRPEYRNLPHDPHPSALAHREYALRLRAGLSDLGYVD